LLIQSERKREQSGSTAGWG